jgi:hypothetical protein
MFHTHVLSVCSKRCICFRRMLHSSVSCFRGVFKKTWGTAHVPGDPAWRVWCQRSRCVARLGHADGGVLFLIPALGSDLRGERSRVAGNEPWAQRYRCRLRVRGRARRTGRLRGLLDIRAPATPFLFSAPFLFRTSFPMHCAYLSCKCSAYVASLLI